MTQILEGTRMLSPEAALLAMSDYGLPQDEILNALAEIDQEGMLAAYKAQLSVELWDRQSPINGVAADKVLERRTDIPADGHIYLIKQGDQVVYFQPFIPDIPGYRMIEDWQSISAQHVEQLARSYTATTALTSLRQQLTPAESGE
jgi:hypothetical protein